MSRSALRRTLSTVLVVVALGLLPAPAAQAAPVFHRAATGIDGPIDLHGFLHHLWTGLVSLWGADGAGADPNGRK